MLTFKVLVTIVAASLIGIPAFAGPATAVERVSADEPCVITVGVARSEDASTKKSTKAAIKKWNAVASGYSLRYVPVAASSISSGLRPMSSQTDITITSVGKRAFKRKVSKALSSYNEGTKGYAGLEYLDAGARGYVVLENSSEPWRTNLVVHEISHALQLGHSYESSSVLNPVVRTTSKFTKKDRKALKAAAASIINLYCPVAHPKQPIT